MIIENGNIFSYACTTAILKKKKADSSTNFINYTILIKSLESSSLFFSWWYCRSRIANCVTVEEEQCVSCGGWNKTKWIPGATLSPRRRSLLIRAIGRMMTGYWLPLPVCSALMSLLVSLFFSSSSLSRGLYTFPVFRSHLAAHLHSKHKIVFFLHKSCNPPHTFALQYQNRWFLLAPLEVSNVSEYVDVCLVSQTRSPARLVVLWWM